MLFVCYAFGFYTILLYLLFNKLRSQVNDKKKVMVDYTLNTESWLPWLYMIICILFPCFNLQLP